MKMLSPLELIDASNPVDPPFDIRMALDPHDEAATLDSVREAQNWITFYKEALDEAAIVAVTDTRGAILSVNRKFCELSGYTEAELIGSNHRLLRSGIHNKAFFRDLYKTISHGRVWHGTICNRAKSGELYWVETTIVPHRTLDGRIQSYTAIRFDITPQKLAEDHLTRLANVDPLTGLPNRRRFIEDLEPAIRRPETGFFVGIMDVDHFKDINDTLGHSAGDELLVEIAQRLRAALPVADFVARLGGDEFAVVLHHGPAQAEALIEQIYKALEPPIWLGGRRLRPSVSLGLTQFPQGGGTVSELLKHADIALYAAKERGRNRAELFDEEMRSSTQRRADLLQAFEHALLNEELCVHYQPIISLATGRMVKMEALLRWQHPQQGLLYPASFHEALLDEGLSALVDCFVLERVLDDCKNWKAEGLQVGTIAINATSGGFRSTSLTARILMALTIGEIAAEEICVEITEGMLIGREGSQVHSSIEELHGKGIKIAFDDFGTGFASLRHLRDVPVDIVKIDKSFVSSLEESRVNRAIVEGIIHLAHHLGKTVIAEGVETHAQVTLLEDVGCDFIQGFLVSAAVPFAQTTEYLRHGVDYPPHRIPNS